MLVEAVSIILFFNYLNDLEKLVRSGSIENNEDPLIMHMPSNSTSLRSGLMAYILADNHSLLLLSVFLLLVLAESKDIEHLLAAVIGPRTMQHRMEHDISSLEPIVGTISVKFMPQILSALLRVLASEPSSSVQIQLHAGWFLQKLLVLQEKKLDDCNLQLFNISYDRSRECFLKELDGCWFDYILDTLRNEWASCKTALEQPSQTKDPFFLVELAVCSQKTDGNASSYVSWQRMVDVVKVFVLHFHLKALICKEEVLEEPSLAPLKMPLVGSGRSHHGSDLSSASFGSEISLGSGTPCRIAFSNSRIKDIYLIPFARETFGKLFLVEKHPFRSQRGVVIAIAPLAGLSPKIDEDHSKWLHLRIREFDPRLNASKMSINYSKGSKHTVDGRWTLGFPNAEACEAARWAILEETNKQRSSVRSALASLLQNESLARNVNNSNAEGS